MESPSVDRARGRAAAVLQEVLVSLHGSVTGRDGTHVPGQGQVPGMAAKCRLASCRKEFQSEP